MRNHFISSSLFKSDLGSYRNIISETAGARTGEAVHNWFGTHAEYEDGEVVVRHDLIGKLEKEIRKMGYDV